MSDWCDTCQSWGNVHDKEKHDLAEGRRLRDEGMQKADAHAHPAWKAVAGAALVKLARTGEEFGAEDVTAIAGMPAQPNAIGSLFSTYAKRGVIVAVGFQQSSRASRHASRQLTWRGTEKARTFAAPPAPDLTERLPQGQMSILEPAWHCPNCDSEIDAKFVTIWDIAPKYGQAGCSKCMKKVTVQFR